MGEVLVDRALKIGNARKGSSSDSSWCDFGEEAFNLIEPARAGRREMENEAGMARKPTLNQRLFVRCIVIKDEMHVHPYRHFSIDFSKESQEFLMPMPSMA